MLGKGESLPFDCKFTGGKVGSASINATYGCPEGDVVFELVHPTKAGADAARTTNFATRVRSGSPPPGLQEALLSLIRARETAFEWKWLAKPSLLQTILSLSLLVLPLMAVVLGFVLLIQTAYRRRARCAETGDTRSGRLRWNLTGTIRLSGTLLVTVIALYGAVERSGTQDGSLVVFLAILSLVVFLWLTLSGFFGYASSSRNDWPALIPFFVAWVVREVFTLHSIDQIDIQFEHGPLGRHSIVYPLLQMFFAPMVRDTQSFTMHMNGVLGALAILPTYLFARQRIRSRGAGFMCALFLAVHPVVARFAPTDGPYSLLLVTWFCGLALLSVHELNARSIFGGVVLIGIAAATRLEGAVLLVASVMMLDPKILVDIVRRDALIAAFASLIALTLVVVQLYFILPTYGSVLPLASWVFQDAVWPAAYNDRTFVILVWVGAAVGIRSRYRLGLVAFLAMLIVLAPVVRSGQWVVTLHRMVPTCAVQAIVAGIGAYSLTAWLPWRNGWRWIGLAPGVVIALYILIEHQSELTTPYVFNEEYGIVRRNLVPGGVALKGCTLLTFNSIAQADSDLHDFGRVVPGMRTIDCRVNDCVAEAAKGGCFYYIRSVASYFHAGGVPIACAEAGVVSTEDRLTCMNEISASFERSIELTPVALRTIDVEHTFPGRRYPKRAQIGLFRVASKTPG
ncbi:MAG: hypothetical protein HY270_16720 [Deltaproteobacteria bacterium]|nr:hypothetical protein [Deltaproteobacteria bacterium]